MSALSALLFARGFLNDPLFIKYSVQAFFASVRLGAERSFHSALALMTSASSPSGKPTLGS